MTSPLECSTCHGTGELPKDHPWRNSEGYTYNHGWACPDCSSRVSQNADTIDLSTKTTERIDMEHRELPMYAYGFKCSCGVVSMGTKEDPAFFSDHLMSVFKEAGI